MQYPTQGYDVQIGDQGWANIPADGTLYDVLGQINENFYPSNNPSGYITNANVVYTTGDQTISGVKTFATRPTVNGTGVLLSGEGGTPVLPNTIVYTTGDQTISGTKNFVNVTETFLSLNIINQAVNFPLNSGMNFILPLTTGITGITFSNVPSNIYSFTLRVDYSGAHAIVWPTGFGGVLWPGNTAPTLTTAVGREDFFSFLTYTSGQEFFGFNIGQNYSGIY
jgi:hypothetical protein